MRALNFSYSLLIVGSIIQFLGNKVTISSWKNYTEIQVIGKTKRHLGLIFKKYWIAVFLLIYGETSVRRK